MYFPTKGMPFWFMIQRIKLKPARFPVGKSFQPLEVDKKSFSVPEINFTCTSVLSY